MLPQWRVSLSIPGLPRTKDKSPTKRLNNVDRSGDTRSPNRAGGARFRRPVQEEMHPRPGGAVLCLPHLPHVAKIFQAAQVGNLIEACSPPRGELVGISLHTIADTYLEVLGESLIQPQRYQREPAVEQRVGRLVTHIDPELRMDVRQDPSGR